jgi:hypothetical protein
MNRNNILTSALILSNIILVILSFMILGITAVAVYWHFSPGLFNTVDITDTFRAGYGFGNIRLNVVESGDPGSGIMLSELNHFMIYWLFTIALFFQVLTILIILKVKSIHRSIRNINSFYTNNLKSFRTLVTYGFIALPFSVFNLIYLEGQLNFRFTIPFGTLILILSSQVLAEVFSEGKNLLEDKNMIV